LPEYVSPESRLGRTVSFSLALLAQEDQFGRRNVRFIKELEDLYMLD
jgi:hypothetical protein